MEPFTEQDASDDALFRLAVVKALRDIAQTLDGIHGTFDKIDEVLRMTKDGQRRYLDVMVDGYIDVNNGS